MSQGADTESPVWSSPSRLQGLSRKCGPSSRGRQIELVAMLPEKHQLCWSTRTGGFFSGLSVSVHPSRTRY